MKTSSITHTIALLLLFLIFLTTSSPLKGNESKKQQIYEKAIAICGFTEMLKTSLKFSDDWVELITIKDIPLPFLYDSLSGKEAYMIVFKESNFKNNDSVSSFQGISFSNRNYYVLLDKDSENIISISTVNPTADQRYEFRAKPENATRYMSERNLIITAIPSIQPTTTFYEAVKSSYMCYPDKCQNIDGYFVQFESIKGNVWYLNYWDCSVSFSKNINPNNDKEYHSAQTCIVSDSLGKCIMQTSAPGSIIDKMYR